jgi:hypothetical protein
MPFPFVPQAYAQCEDIGNSGGIDLGNCLTLDGTTQVRDVYSTPADIVNVLVGAVFVIGGLLVFYTIFSAGLKFIRSGTKGKDEAKTMLSTAMMGLIVMFIAYWIVRILEVVVRQDIIF